MKHSVFTKILCLALCAAVCFTIPFCFTATALNVSSGETGIKADVQALSDLTVMTYNVLANDGNGKYLAAKERAPYVVDTINRYSPDIIGFQEVQEETTFLWSDGWLSYFEDYGITDKYTLLQMNNMTEVGSSLVIAFKNDLFTVDSQGQAEYDYTAAGVTSDQPRYYKWAKLTHKASGKTIVVTDTHLSINADNKSNPTEEGGAVLRYAEAAQLKEYWDNNVTEDTIFFGMGDYNTSFKKESNLAGTKTLEHLSSNSTFKSAAKVALFADNNSSNSDNYIDHIFVNPSVSDVIEHHRVTDTYNDIKPSDHEATIAYVNFKATFANGKYDATKRTLTDTVAERTYTIKPALLDDFTYTVKDEAGNTVGSTVNLIPGKNKYTVTVSSSTGNQIGAPIDVTITCTDTSLDPTVSAPDALAAYYGKDEIHVALLQGKTATTLSFEGAATYELYKDANCTTAQSPAISGFTGNRATYYLKVTSGNTSYTVPVKLYHPTDTTLPADTLYCDDNWESLASGTTAVWDDGTNILFPAIGTTAFGTITQMADYINTENYSGYTGYVAAGTYYDQATIKKSFTLLGANHDIDPLIRGNDKWTQNTARRPESIIHGFLEVSDTTSVTVKGFHFISEQPVQYAAIQLNANGDTSTVTPQIENNIFDHALSSASNSPIQAIGSAKKAGSIKNNIFRNNPIGRGLTMRNLDGIVISGNYFYNQGTSLYLNSEISSGNKNPGHLFFTLSGNRFENCYKTSVLSTAYAVNGATISILKNQFISNHGAALSIALNQAVDIEDEQTVDFSNINLNINGNVFKNNFRGISVTSNNANIKNATVKINQNSIDDCNEYALNVSCSDTSVSDASPFIVDASYNYLDSGVADPVSHITVGNNSTVNYTPYYTDAALKNLSGDATLKTISDVTVSGYTGPYDGNAHGVTVDGTQAGDIVTYSTDGYAYTTTAPFLTDVGSETVYVSVSRVGYNNFITTTDIKITPADFTGILVKDYNGIYDGKAHGITLEGVPSDAHIYYSTDNETSTETAPTFTDAGEYTVYVTVIKANYTDFSATATVTITGLPLEGISVLPYFGKADGKSHNVTVNGLKEGDIVTYSVNDGDFVADPEISDAKSHDVVVKVERINHQSLEILSRVTLVNSDDGKIVSLITQSPTILQSGDAYSLLWTMMIAPSTSFVFGGEDIQFISYGMIYSNDQDKLAQYAEQGALGTTPDIDNVRRYVYAEPDEGETYLRKVYKTYRHEITGVGEGKERCAMAFIRFQYNKKLYEVYSPITDGSVILGGVISGTGAPVLSPDTLDD